MAETNESVDRKADHEIITVEANVIEERSLSLMPVMDLDEAKRRYAQMVKFVSELMEEGRDYGIIPGTEKPTLYKPGAEKLATFFGLRKTFDLLDGVQRWDQADPFFFYRYKVQLWRGDILIAEGIGSANSFEDRYRWRWVSLDKVPPGVNADELEKRGGRLSEYDFAIEAAETSGQYGKPAWHWERFKRAIDDGSARRIDKPARSGKTYPAYEIDATYYRVPNPDVFTQVNTLDKMAQKRAFIQGVLIAVNASEFFTQDLEDMPPEAISGQVDSHTPPPGYATDSTEDTPFRPPIPEGTVAKGTPRPHPPETVRNKWKAAVVKFAGAEAEQMRGKITLRQKMAWQLRECFPGDEHQDDKSHSVIGYLTEDRTTSSKDLTGPELIATERWLDSSESEGPDSGFVPRKESRQEAALIVTARMKELGQGELL